MKRTKTYGPLQGEYFDWHKGRPKYAVWVLEPTSLLLSRRVNSAQKYLSDVLMDDYQRSIHITVAQCGFLVEKSQWNDDYDASSLMIDVEKLQSCGVLSIEMLLKNQLITYAIAPGFEVLDPLGQLKYFNQMLNRGAGNNDSDYFPHVTVGLYSHEWQLSEIRTRLSVFPIEEDISLISNKLKLVSYAPLVSGGALQDELIFDLQTQEILYLSDTFKLG